MIFLNHKELQSDIRENNVWENETITYTYDTGGNLLNKKAYPYTTDNDLSQDTPTHIYGYQYSNSGDSDQLTSYDGNSITYNSNGNILTLNGWTYAWNGKNLSTASDSDNNVSYQYNADGIRTSKTVNDVTTNYTLDDNGTIIAQTDGTNTLNFTYDSNGNLQYMTLNGAKYTYVCNVE